MIQSRIIINVIYSDDCGLKYNLGVSTGSGNQGKRAKAALVFPVS